MQNSKDKNDMTVCSFWECSQTFNSLRALKEPYSIAILRLNFPSCFVCTKKAYSPLAALTTLTLENLCTEISISEILENIR